jgi:hypothetical protein
MNFTEKELEILYKDYLLNEDTDEISDDEHKRRMDAAEKHFKIVFESREIEYNKNDVFATINKIVKRKKIGTGKTLNYHYYIDGEYIGSHNKICGIKNYYETPNGEVKVKEKKKYYTPVEVKKKTGRKSKLTDQQIKEIKESNLTQRKLAELFGVAQSMITRIKNNKN